MCGDDDGVPVGTGLTGGLSRALATERLVIHDRGRVLAGLACAIAHGGEVISDFRVIGNQHELFGQVAPVPVLPTLGALSRQVREGVAELRQVASL